MKKLLTTGFLLSLVLSVNVFADEQVQKTLPALDRLRLAPIQMPQNVETPRAAQQTQTPAAPSEQTEDAVQTNDLNSQNLNVEVPQNSEETQEEIQKAQENVESIFAPVELNVENNTNQSPETSEIPAVDLKSDTNMLPKKETAKESSIKNLFSKHKKEVKKETVEQPKEEISEPTQTIDEKQVEEPDIEQNTEIKEQTDNPISTMPLEPSKDTLIVPSVNEVK